MVSIILIDYFSGEKTINFIKEIISKSDKTEINFIVVDNSVNMNNTLLLIEGVGIDLEEYNGLSSDIVCGCIQETPVDIVINNANIGYGPGANVGIEYAIRKYKADYVLISNNDMKVLDDTLKFKEMITILDETPNIGLIGPSIIGLDGKPQTPCKKVTIKDRWIIPCLVYPFNRLLRQDKSDDLIVTDKDMMVYRIMGSFMFFRATTLIEIGLFDENTFLYAEESIIAEKLLERGYQTYYYSTVRMLHEHNQTIGNFYNKIDKLKLRFSSEMYYYHSYCGVSKLTCLVAKVIFCSYIIRLKIVNFLRGKSNEPV
jgi:GT2 family glycosyltransferase